MGVGEIIGIVLGSDVVVFVLTQIFNRKHKKTEDKQLDIEVLQSEIEFLSNRCETLNQQLNAAVEKVVELQHKIMELSGEIENKTTE